MSASCLDLRLRVWRQVDADQPGSFETHHLAALSPDLSLLEALDRLNEQLVARGLRPVGFDHDCREGICGACGFLVNGQPQGSQRGTTVCQLYLRHFLPPGVQRAEVALTLEPFRARAFAVQQDLSVDRSGLDRILMAGGYCSVNTGSAPEANAILIGRDQAASAFLAATCIGCGACVAACPNASASLFTAARLAHLALLPQGQPERPRRVAAMLERMQAEGFGGCSSHLECEAACPQEISADWISWLQRERRRPSTS
ncbi:MAG: succinate dehydrogenase/fumarate reductase iron-sulfur subunit [Cyanobium sp.]